VVCERVPGDMQSDAGHCGSLRCQLIYAGEIYQQCECACTDCCAARRVEERADAGATWKRHDKDDS